MPAPSQPTMRRFGDHAATRTAVFDGAFNAVQNLPPTQNSRYALGFSDVGWSGPEVPSYADHKQAMIEGRSLSRRLTGNVALTDRATNKVVDSRRMTIASVPTLTHQGVFVTDGNPLIVAHQSRLLPGLFTRRKGSGIVETHSNILPGTGVPHRIILDPATGVFKTVVGQAEIPTISLLKILGATPEELRHAWGDELYTRNSKADRPHHVEKYWERMGPPGVAPDGTDKPAVLAQRLSQYPLDPWVSQRLLGKPYDRYGKEPLLLSTKKMIGIARGEREPDDRDNPIFSTVWGPEHLIAERLTRSGPLMAKILWQATNTGNLKRVQPGFLSPAIRGLFTKSGLALMPEGSNASEFMDHGSRLTKVGEGGIGRDAESVPMSSRDVHGNQFPFIDSVRTSESESVGVDLRVAFGTRLGADKRLYAPVRDTKTNKLVFRSVQDMADKTLAFPGAMHSNENVVPVIRDGKITYAPKAEVDFVVPSMEQSFSPMTGLIPMKSAAKPHRASMGARMSVSGDTQILVSRCTGELYRGSIEAYIWQPGDTSISIDKATKQLTWKPIRGKIVHENVKRMYRVLFKGGRHVDATHDHSFVTMDNDGELVKIHTQALDRKTLIPVAGRYDIPTCTVPSQWVVPVGNKHNSYDTASFDLDYDTGWIHGLFLSEGHVTTRSRDGLVRMVTLANIDPVILDRASSFFESRGFHARISCGRPDGVNDRVVIGWSQLGIKLASDFGSGSYNKKIPSWVFTAPLNYREGVIGGYLAGDGISAPRRTRFSICGGSRSFRLRDDLCELLLTLGIDTTRSNTVVDTGPGDTEVVQYRFEVRAEHVNSLPKTYHRIKDERIAKSRWSGKRSGDVFPAFPALRKLIYPRLRKGTPDYNRIRSNKLVREVATRVLGLEGTTTTHAWLRSNVTWIKVDSVVELPQDLYPYVYDLDLEDNVFVVNGGVFVHNTTQSLPLKYAEAPLVRTQVPGQPGRSFEEMFGRHMGAVFANNKPGTVAAVDPDSITVQYADGTTHKHERYNHLPSGRKTGLNTVPLIKPGDQVAPGQILAKSNYTDNQGHAAYGMNLRIGFMNMKGHAYEDAIVLSESAAKKMTSDHLYKHYVPSDEDVLFGKAAHVAAFPGRHPVETLKNYDDDGVVKIGTKVSEGDPLILAVRRKQGVFGRLSRSGKASLSDASDKWEYEEPGTVVGVHRTKNGPVVLVQSEKGMKSGDKLSGKYGNKGVSVILPDDQMPIDKDGKPLEIVISSLGVISRANPASKYEALLGKLAAKTGQPYVVNDWDDEGTNRDVGKMVRDELAKHGVEAKEDLTDPMTGRKIPGVLTGMAYIMKLHHMSECYDDVTDVLTRRGWVRWPDVTADDELATVINGVIVYERPTSIVRQHYNGPMYGFSGRYIDYAVTGNHRMYVRGPHTGDPFRFAAAADIHGTRFSVQQFGFTVPDGPGGRVVITPGLELDWDDYGELVGWWAGEGYANVKRGYVVLYQSYKVNRKYYEQIEAMARRIGLPWHHYRSYGQKNGIVISSRPLTEYLARYGTYSHNKQLPRTLLSGPITARKAAYTVMVNGDGRWHMWDAPMVKYFTTSKRLADDFQELCIGLGFGAIVRPDAPKRNPKHLPSWTCCVALTRTIAQVDGERGGKQFSITEYDGYVYCAEVSTGLLYVRRNGKPLLCGNSKVKGRGLGGYDASGQPLRGQSGRAMRSSLGDTNALLSHGATDLIADAHLHRGQDNPESWLSYMSGYPAMRPTVSKPFERFLTELRAAGIDPVKRDGRYHLMALTDKRVQELAGGREVKNGETLDFSRSGEPVPGGLFDSSLFGTVDNPSTWAKISLHEPMLSPAMEEPARRLLGLTEKRFRDIIAGRDDLNGETGMAGLRKALGAMDVQKELTKTRLQAQSSRKTAREGAFRKLFFLKGLERTGQSPTDWFLSAVPVLPPGFRPVSAGGPGRGLVVHDANLVYADLINANHAFRDLSSEVADTGDERLNLYDAVKAVVGLGDPVGAKNRERGVKGVLGRLLGDTAKHSYLQTKLLGTPVNLSGRGQVIPNPDLDLDQAGIPESMAKDIYHPFVVRRLVRGGMGRVDAAREVEAWGTRAKHALTEEMASRPVLMTRYPALHRYNVMAFNPVLVTGDAIHTNHLINKGYNLDHDGDDHHAVVILVIDSGTMRTILGGTGATSDLTFWESRLMTARFNVSLPVTTDDSVYCVNLEDFPRGELVTTKGHIDIYTVPSGVRVVAYDQTNNRPVITSVAQWSIHRDRVVETVELLSGRQIITDDDPRAVYGIDPNTLLFTRRRPKDATGIMVPRVDRLEVAETRQTIAFGHGDRKLDIRLSRPFGYFIGLLVGNGWVSGDGRSLRQINLATSDDGVRDAYLAAFQIVFNETPHITVTTRSAQDVIDNPTSGLSVSRKLVISDTFKALAVAPLIGHGARQKHLPAFFLSGDYEFRLGLFEGLMDTDGSIATSHAKTKPQLKANYTTSSLRLAQEIQHLCRSLGVLATVSYTQTPAGRDFWCVNFAGVDFTNLELNLKHTAKAAAWATRPPVEANSGPAQANHMLPMPGVLVDYVRDVLRRAKLVLADLYTPLTSARAKSRIPRSQAQKLIALMEVEYGIVVEHPLWLRWKALVADESTVWDTVVGYTHTGKTETGYDLSVPGFETFMSTDGVILSNTMTVNVPLSDDGVKEAYEKLLPSRNLYSPATFKPTVAQPNMEIQQGLHAASTVDDNNHPIEFRTRKDAIAAYLRGEFRIGTRVRVLED